jgi:alanine-synthesizing transaminase
MTDKSTRHFARINRLPPYVFNITAELKMAARRRGEDIIDFSMGNPDGATPAHIVEKLCSTAQRADTHGYSTSRGIPRLRRAISHWYQQRYQVAIDPESEAIVTIGSKEGLAHLMLATLDQGDTVLVPNPSYPIHIYGAVIAGAQVRSVPLIPGVDFFAELERAIRESIPKPKMIIIGFPSNPTAQCVELDFFERVVALARQYDIMVVHDLAYADIVYEGWKAPSIMQVPGAKDVAVEFFTLSKSYNMAGWRIGFMVGNAELVNRWRASRATTITALSPRCRWRPSPPWKATSNACWISPRSTASAATCWSRDCTKSAGWRRNPRPRCTSGQRYRPPTRTWAHWSLPRSCSARPRSASRQASALASTAMTMCASP